jgi:hypothetical protein
MVVKMENNQNPQLIYSWKAPMRAYKKTTTGIMRFYIALSLLLSLIVFFFGEKILILPIWAIMFLYYAFTITPPHEVENRITRFGIEAAGNTYRWESLSHFYFIKKFDYDILVMVAELPNTSRLYLVVENQESKENLIKILSEHLIYQENPNKSVTDKMSEYLTKLMP